MTSETLGRGRLALVMGLLMVVGMIPSVSASLEGFVAPMEDHETAENSPLTANISGQVYLGYSGDDQGLNALVLAINSSDEIYDHTQTEDDGAYEFLDVPPDTYELIAIPLDPALPGERSVELEVEEDPETGKDILRDLENVNIGAGTFNPVPG